VKRCILMLILFLVAIVAMADESRPLASPRASLRPADAPREIELGGIVGVLPGYIGGDKLKVMGGIYFEANFGNGVFLGQDGIGFRSPQYGPFSVAASISPSLSRRERDGNADSPNRLSGMGDVAQVAQANLFGNYDAGPYHVAAEFQHELGSRDGIEFQLSGLYDIVSSPQNLVQLFAGVDYANQAKMQTFFGVTDAQASSSGNASFTPTAGIAGSGVGASWRHAFSQNWVGALDVAMISLSGSAADSPLTARKTSVYSVASFGYRF
jgi:outer membrane protein